MKQCSKCAVVKPYTEFSPHKMGKGGVRSICKPCSTAYALAYQKTPKGAEAARQRARHQRTTAEGRAYRAQQHRIYYEQHPEKYLVIRARSRAKRKGVPFDLTPADVVIPERCPILGTPLKLGKAQFREGRFGGAEDAPSLDRLDPARGYVPGNVAVISWRANRLKNNASLQELEAIVQWIRQKNLGGLT